MLTRVSPTALVLPPTIKGNLIHCIILLFAFHGLDPTVTKFRILTGLKMKNHIFDT